MDQIKGQLAELNRLLKENNELYHNIALRCVLSDCAFWILYVLFNETGPVSQVRLSTEWYYSKQTVNSAISSLIDKGLVKLAPASEGRHRKQILLTEKGLVYADRVVNLVNDIEQKAFSRLTQGERETLLSLLRKTVSYTREEFQKSTFKVPSGAGSPERAINETMIAREGVGA